MTRPDASNVPVGKRSLQLAILPLALAIAMGLAACGQKDEKPQGPPPPPEVGVVTAEPTTVGLVSDLPGRLESSRVAEVRARASGIVLKRVFREGSDVKAGQVLYEIDPAPYKAALQNAEASLAQAQATLAQASSTAARYRPLVQANAVSKQEYDVAVANEKQARAQVSAGKAAVDTARINLGYATVTAPISGRIGRSQVTEGALVGQTDQTPLATIQQVNPLYVNLTQSASEVLALRSQLADGKLASAGADAAKVKILAEDGKPYPHEGKLLFSDLTVDPGTGQVSVRAEVANPDGMLLPGMYVRVRIEQAQIENAILLPQQAVTRGAQDTVMIIGDDGSVTPRTVTVSGQKDGQWIVVDGLKTGEKVMVDGFMKLQMGTKTVKPVPWAKGGGANPAASGASAPASAASK
ncbi:efflux transporter periplasmic adaptor subunit [Comamonas serinivorans]|uniref:Efflux transporter periplasmic adaptor subunit n=1 Tax=Comamonas serinivorans TaxID=1082851 RepID=A0A1Y0EJE5_9BURK|nr:efflux RND transporter periplasmic adaptor subunit [Comamonas serinivorans]ARU03707.1 efflux transporter periplasmic adaptor subunit [Comamonas serinivorans]